jgi:hypothetical protein
MKAFSECDRRREDRCIQFNHACAPDMEMGVGYPEGCWRMCEEKKEFLQCPDCFSDLWFDNHVANILGSGNIFFCPRCGKDIHKSKAVQTMKRLVAKLKLSKSVVLEYERSGNMDNLLPRESDAYNFAHSEVSRIKEMIVALAEKENK